MPTLSDNAKKFIAKKPTKLATMAGYKLFECPVYGDEGFIWCITPQGKLKQTNDCELPMDIESLLCSIGSYPQ